MVVPKPTPALALCRPLYMVAASQLIAWVIAGVFVCGCDRTPPREAGRVDAQRDLEKGILRLETFGRHPMYQIQYYYPMLRKRYGIRIVDYGCIVDDRMVEHSLGYNEVMDRELCRRFGTNFWQLTMDDARRTYETNLATGPGR